MSEALAESLPLLAKALIALFIIVDPIGNIPIFIGLTGSMNKEQRRKIFRTATLTGFVLLLVFALVGQQVLALFGISLYSFMIAGGILLLIVAVRLLAEGNWKGSEGATEAVGAVPIAVPLLVGPGAITTTIFTFQQFGIVITVVAVVIVFALVWLVLRLADPIYRFLGNSGSAVIARIMALLIAAIAVQYILDGVTHYLPMA